MCSLINVDNPETVNDNQLSVVLKIVADASRVVMKLYNDSLPVDVRYKADNSPLTKADLESHRIITEALSKSFPSIPIVSEEGSAEYNQQAVNSDRFWLVDPIDGTKEFIAHNGQFTICIALIEKGKPVFGVVSAPALGTTYYGGSKMGSYKIDTDGNVKKLQISAKPTNVIFGSRSHPNTETADFIARYYGNHTVQEVGSQLKIVLIADGQADAYPRLSTTMRLWDIAAGQAVLEGAGGSLARPDSNAIDYSDNDLLAGDFVARAA